MKKAAAVMLLAIFFVGAVSADEIQESHEKAARGFNLNDDVKYTESKYTAAVTDLTCENVFESVNYGENLIQLGKIQLIGLLNRRDVRSGLVSVSRQMVWAPRLLEEKYAEKLHKDRLEAGDVIDDISKLPFKEQEKLKQTELILKRIVDNLPSDSDYTFRLFVSRDSGVNAFAIPAGYIYITRDTLKKSDLNMIAFMLAHEIAHVTKRHEVKELKVRTVDGMTGIGDILAIMNGSGDPSAIGRVIGHAVAVKNLLENYSIAQESEADGCAIKLLANQQGVDVRKGVLGFLEKEKGLSLKKEKAQSHPNYQNRQQLIFTAYTKYSKTRYVGDKSNKADKVDGGTIPLQSASEKNSEINNNSGISSGLSGWLGGVTTAVGNVFSSSSQSKEPEKADAGKVGIPEHRDR